jgi:hypothetical protein
VTTAGSQPGAKACRSSVTESVARQVTLIITTKLRSKTSYTYYYYYTMLNTGIELSLQDP